MFTNIRRRVHEFHDEYLIYYINMVNKCVSSNCTSGYATGEKSHVSFFQITKNVARNGFISLIARTGHGQNILLYVLTTSLINL